MFHCVSRVLAVLTAVALLARAPGLGSAQTGPTILSGFPTLKQQHLLTCEASAASMGTHGALTEAQIMAVMPRHPDPNFGFRGNPDGPEEYTRMVNYGVYAAPLRRSLQHYGYDSTLTMYGTRNDIKRSIDAGRPVVAWITYRLQKSQPRLAEYAGTHFLLVPHEHAVLVIGYDAQTVIANDPWVATQVRYRWNDFERSWGLFGNMALSMDPCPAAKPVTRIAVAGVDTGSLVWTWTRATNAVRYDVTVVRHGSPDVVLFHDMVVPHRFALPSPAAGGSYEITVRSVSGCGIESRATSEWFDAPAVLPTPSPTPIPETPSVTPTAGPSPTASPTPRK